MRSWVKIRRTGNERKGQKTGLDACGTGAHTYSFRTGGFVQRQYLERTGEILRFCLLSEKTGICYCTWAWSHGVFSRMDYELFERYAVHAYLLSLVLSGLVLVAGSAYNGSRRWLSFGPLPFQPAEFAKAAVIISASRTISRQKSRHHPGGMGMILKVMGQILPVAALVGTNNLSTAVIILGIGAVLVFVSDPRYLPFAGLGIAGAGFIAVFLGMETYRLERLAVWRDPEQYEKGFQTIQGLYAIGSGGLFGTGLGSSMQKLGFVPEAQNDMIFSII